MSYYCFNITSRCNMKCQYCYRVGNLEGDVLLNDAKKYIDLLAYRGCDVINITGGEPLLHSYWKEIVNYAYKIGLKVILSTNGLLLDFDDEILNKVWMITLPLDGSVESVNKKTRSVEQYKKCIFLINKYKENDYSFLLRVNTVVSKYNYGDIFEIYKIVNCEKISWKLFKLRKKGKFNSFSEEYLINDSTFVELCKSVERLNSNCNIRFQGNYRFSFCSVDENPLVLNYDGKLYYTSEDKDELICDLSEEF